MEQVLVSGGSGGGHALFLVSDYFKSILPKTVTKYAVAPINGWYVADTGSLADMYSLMKPDNIVPSSCRSAFSSSEQYKCLIPEVAYRYTQASMFMTQIADYTLQWGTEDDVKSAYTKCLTPDINPSEVCTSEDVSLVQGYFDNYTALLKSYPRYNQNCEGGYLSTCTVHVFYNEDDMFSIYANNGVTVGDAITKWWDKFSNNPPAQWYLPCTLGNEKDAQCEKSCGNFYMQSEVSGITREMETWLGL